MSTHAFSSDAGTAPVVVFLGPSLPVAEARRIFPGGTFLPPARQGDVLSAVGIYRPRAIALVDGEFGQSLSVWHKEILFALERGIHVFGASSMGALRASECAAFGMKGVGRVFSMFASGELTDDDEVALAHAHDDEAGYRALSEPMVNLRVNLAEAERAGIVDAGTRDRLTELAKSLYFPERSYARVLRLAEREGVPGPVVERLRAWLKENARDVKRADAVELLTLLRDLPADVAPHEPDFRLERTALFEALYHRDRRVRHDGYDVALSDIASYAALHVPDFGDLVGHALNRALASVLAEMLEVEVTEEMVDEEVRRFSVRRRIPREGGLERWMRENDMEPHEFRALMRNLAEARVLQRWLATKKWHARINQEILDELRLRGTYPEVAAKAAAHERVLAEVFPHEMGAPADEAETLRLVVEHMRATPCRMDTAYGEWAEDAGFHRVEDFRTALQRARVVRGFFSQIADAAVGAVAGG